MIIAHIPLGYIVYRGTTKVSSKLALFSSLLGSVFPDTDLFYSYFVDRQHHHTCWTHQPFYWLFLSFCMLLLTHKKSVRLFLLNVWVHLIVDTLVGDIQWLFPFSDKFYSFCHIIPKYDWWLFNFILHWTFFVEVILCLISLYLLLLARRHVPVNASCDKHDDGKDHKESHRSHEQSKVL